jgi:hypothetical protein
LTIILNTIYNVLINLKDWVTIIGNKDIWILYHFRPKLICKYFVIIFVMEIIITRTITKCDYYPRKTASEMRRLLVTEYLVKELKWSYGCGVVDLWFLYVAFPSMWFMTIDEVLLNYSVLSPERRVTLLKRCTSSHCAWPLHEVALNSKH